MLARLVVNLVSELVAPARCAACDTRVGPKVLFCEPCAVTVLRGPRGPRATAAFEYGGAMATAIVRLKYGDRLDLGYRLGEALAAASAHLAATVDAVVPVPLHPRRLADRGFDQVAVLASPVARALGVPLVRALCRVRDTPKQASMDRASRLANVAGAFACGAPGRVAERRIALVDDVRTTGATAMAAQRTLEVAGARAVHVLVLASREPDESGGAVAPPLRYHPGTRR